MRMPRTSPLRLQRLRLLMPQQHPLSTTTQHRAVLKLLLLLFLLLLLANRNRYRPVREAMPMLSPLCTQQGGRKTNRPCLRLLPRPRWRDNKRTRKTRASCQSRLHTLIPSIPRAQARARQYSVGSSRTAVVVVRAWA